MNPASRSLGRDAYHRGAVHPIGGQVLEGDVGLFEGVLHGCGPDRYLGRERQELLPSRLVFAVTLTSSRSSNRWLS